jgi:hypothetical protein
MLCSMREKCTSDRAIFVNARSISSVLVARVGVRCHRLAEELLLAIFITEKYGSVDLMDRPRASDTPMLGPHARPLCT